MESDSLGDVAEFFGGDFAEVLSEPVEFLGESDGLFLHSAMGFVASADEVELVAAGDADMLVGVVEPDAEEERPLGGVVARVGVVWVSGHETVRPVQVVSAAAIEDTVRYSKDFIGIGKAGQR